MMSKILTLARREIAGYFYSPLAYVVGVLFLVFCGSVFFFGLRPLAAIDAIFRPGSEASLRGLFEVMAWAMTAVAPLLTMRLVSEEFNSGTIETLMTAPVTDTQVVLGKFLGVLTFYLMLLSTTGVYFLLILIYGQPDLGIAAMGYLGMVLLGAAFLSVGLFASTLTPIQLIAGVVSLAILVGSIALVYFLTIFGSEGLDVLASKLNVMTYFKDFARGTFDTRGVVFFLSITGLFLFMSVKVLESRRWR